MGVYSRMVSLAFVAALATQQPTTLWAAAEEPAAVSPTYADIVTLADSADLVIKAQLRKLVRVENERAPGLQAGWGRYYVNARTRALLTGNAPIGESLTYLVDLPLDAKGKPPKLKKEEVLIFARPVRGRPGELQLVAPRAQLLWSAPMEDAVRTVLKSLLAPEAPPSVTGVREIIHVPGALAGQGETQIFLTTSDQSAASITVRHQPGSKPAWGVSFSELVADVGNPPAPDTLEWFRLACFLPNALPHEANLSETAEARRQAAADYAMILGELGPCRRNRS